MKRWCRREDSRVLLLGQPACEGSQGAIAKLSLLLLRRRALETDRVIPYHVVSHIVRGYRTVAVVHRVGFNDRSSADALEAVLGCVSASGEPWRDKRRVESGRVKVRVGAMVVAGAEVRRRQGGVGTGAVLREAARDVPIAGLSGGIKHHRVVLLLLLLLRELLLRERIAGTAGRDSLIKGGVVVHRGRRTDTEAVSSCLFGRYYRSNVVSKYSLSIDGDSRSTHGVTKVLAKGSTGVAIIGRLLSKLCEKVVEPVARNLGELGTCSETTPRRRSARACLFPARTPARVAH